MMATLLSLAGYLFYILCMMVLSCLVAWAMCEAFPSVMDNFSWIAIPVALFLPFALKNFAWALLISGFHYNLPSTASEVIAILLCVASYLVCMTIGLVLFIIGSICDSELGQLCDKELPSWTIMITGGGTFVVMDMFLSYSEMLLNDMRGVTPVEKPAFISELIFSDMKATLVGLAPYLFHAVLAMAPSHVVLKAISVNGPEKMKPFVKKYHNWIAIFTGVSTSVSIHTETAMISVFRSTTLGTLLGLDGYLLWTAAAWVLLLGGNPISVVNDPKQMMSTFQPWRVMSFVVSPLAMKYIFNSNIIATLLGLAGYLATLLALVVLSFLVLITALAVLIFLPKGYFRPELILAITVGLTLLLLNMMWGSPFKKPSTDSNMKDALVGITGYIIYIMCSVAFPLFLGGAALRLSNTFIISLTFVLLDLFVKPSDIIAALVGLAGMISTPLMAFFLVVALSFVVFMFLHTWAEILLSFPMVYNYPPLTFASIMGLNFMVMKTMLAMPVEKPFILSEMKAELGGIADMVNDYHVAYLVIRYLTVLSIPLLSMEFRRTTLIFKLYMMAAFIVALGLVLTIPPTEKPTSTVVLDYFFQRTITSFVTHTILILVTLMGGMVFYVLNYYDSWKQALTEGGDEFIATALPEAKAYLMDLVHGCTRGWCGKRNVNGSSRRANPRAHRR